MYASKPVAITYNAIKIYTRWHGKLQIYNEKSKLHRRNTIILEIIDDNTYYVTFTLIYLFF